MQQVNTGQHLILYDGVCGLCNGLVRLILRRDKACVFRFASLQSDYVRQFLLQRGINLNASDTIYVIPNFESAGSTVLARADASLFVASQLGWPWRWLVVIDVLPHSWLDSAYGLIAKHRYRWFGKAESCFAPPESDRWRFLDE